MTGKGENIWDKWCHEGGHVSNNDTGDVACDSYNLYGNDINILQQLGVFSYRHQDKFKLALHDLVVFF